VSVKSRLTQDMKQAMRSGDKARLSTIRMALAAIQQREVDERIELDEVQSLGVLDKMIKQRRESVEQYRAGGREDLAAKESAEIEVLAAYLPEPLAEDELAEMIDAAVAETGAGSMKDMGRVMAVLRARTQGRADMAKVSAMVKARLGS
jgi:uncharacterized protein